MAGGVKQFAVVGDPIAHSLSPDIHRAFASKLGHEISYEKIQVTRHELFGFLKKQLGHLDGCNITLPHKSDILKYCYQLDESAQIAGAANTLRADTEGWYGANTDGRGLVHDIHTQLGWNLADANVVVFGAGGAVRGILPALIEAGVARVHIANRSQSRVEQLLEDLADGHANCDFTHSDLTPVDGQFNLVIHALSAAHSGALSLPLAWRDSFGKGIRGYDLCYGAAHLPFAQWWRSAALDDNALADGLGMLVAQAAYSYEIWMGAFPDPAPVLRSLKALHYA